MPSMSVNLVSKAPMMRRLLTMRQLKTASWFRRMPTSVRFSQGINTDSPLLSYSAEVLSVGLARWLTC